MKKFFSKAFNINEGEHGRVLLSLLIFLLVMSGIILGRNARDSIFLKNVGIKYLPYMYLLNAVFVVFVSVVYSSVIDKMDRVRFMVGSSAIYAGLAVLMRVLLFVPGMLKPAATFCYVAVQILWLIGLMQFWTFMGDVFDARESKRLFPVISSGGLLGMVAAGLGGKYLIKGVGGTENLFIVWAVMQGVSILLILTLAKKYIKKGKPSAKSNAPKKSQAQEFKEGFTYLKSSQLLITMVFINLAMWIVFTIVDYQFNKVMSQTYTSKDDLTAFLGFFRAGAGFLCLIIQLGLTSRIVTFLGVGRTIAIHPSYMVAATAFLSMKFGYISSFVSKFGDHVLLYTVQDSSYQMLYNPIPPDRRGRARAFVEGYIKPISMGIAGIILICVTLFPDKIGPAHISALSFAASIVWVVFSLRANAGYVKALTENLTTTDLNLRASAMVQLSKLSDANNMRVLHGVLKSGDRDMALFALEMLESLKTKESIADIRGLLSSGDTDIRAAAIDALSSIGDASILESVRPLLNDPKAEVRQSAIKAFGRLGDETSLALISPLLSDKKRRVRSEAIVALIKAGGLDGILQAGDILKTMLDNPEAQEREHAAEILGMIKVKHFTPTLLRLVNDPDAEVRFKAIKALAKIEDARAAGPLIDSLADKQTAIHAKKGLAELKAKALPDLIEAANDRKRGIDIRRRCAKLIGKIPGPEAAAALIELLKDPEPSVRYSSIVTLSHNAWAIDQKQALREPLTEFLDREVQYIYTLKLDAAALQTMPGSNPPAIFLDALDEFATLGLERVFRALSILLDRAAVRGIWAKLKSGDPKQKPLALEALDNIGERDLTRKVSPLFEDRQPADAVVFYRNATGSAAPTAHGIYSRLSADASPWLRGCAAYAIGESADPASAALAEKLSSDADPFVSETAKWSLKKLAG